MIIEINYTALHWENHQGGSGRPITGRLLRDVPENAALNELKRFAVEQVSEEGIKHKNLIGDYELVNVVIDA